MRVAVVVPPALAAGLALLAPAAGPAQSITLGQKDTFESGTTQNWGVGNAFQVQPTVQPGGPGGPSDHFLQIVAGTGGTPHLTVLNRAQWTGNYVTAGVNAIELDAINPSSTAVALRIGVESQTGGTGPGYVSTVPLNLPPAPSPGQAQWVHFTFLLTDNQMTPVGFSPPPLSQVLTSVAEVRILNIAGTPTSLQGDTPPFGTTVTVGVDNVHAVFVPVPEPGHALAAALAAAGLAGAWRRVRAGRGARR